MMERAEIIRLARESGFDVGTEEGYAFVLDSNNLNLTHLLQKFAALVAAAEREECAKVCCRKGKGVRPGEHWPGDVFAAAIRARGAK